MKIHEIIGLYQSDSFPTNLDELAAIQSKVDDYAKSSLGFAHAETNEAAKTLYFSEATSYNAISAFLDVKIMTAVDMKGGETP